MKAHRRTGESFFHDVVLDMKLILAYEGRAMTAKNIVWALLACDAYMLILTFRMRKLALKYRIPLVNRLIRLWQTMMYAIELGVDIELGHGVYFVHTVGTVVGGDARIGEGCVFFGNNTVGAARFPGSPVIGAYTVLGAGVRVLGRIEIGENCFFGANAVVVQNVENSKIAVGIPARVVSDNEPIPNIERMKYTA